MLETLHRIGSGIRHFRLLEEQKWLWETVEPCWQGAFSWFSRQRGFTTQINGDVFRLTYAVGSRYARVGKGFYEPSFYQPFVERLKEGMTVLDIGAHVGFFTLGAALRVGQRGRVYAFEPAPDTFAVLRQHIALNRLRGRVVPLKAVVSDLDGAVPFYAHGVTMAASLARANVEVINPEQLLTPALQVEIASVTLDQFCAERRIQPDVAKIDVEGAELRVLKGARELLQKKSLIILCEVHPRQMENCGSSLPEMKDYLQSVGYSIERLDEPNAMGIFHSLIARRDRSGEW
jgi:FkbM family methyltransferase